jgi:succinoglycan biosynthesis protein ExoM
LHIAICIGTFRRPELLQHLLVAISQLQFRKMNRPEIDVIVVDNDASRGAEPVCRLANYPWTIRYVCEPRRGIARVRNRAIAEADRAAFLAFIDDDEAPAPEWLDELLWAQSQFQADVVSGSVWPAFSAEVPAWIKTGGFFSRSLRPTGDVVDLCSTNNVLIRRDTLRSVPGFDEKFAFTGGEDTHFFLRVRRLGFRMVASQEAVVYEPISEGRANMAWILRRGYQSGNSWALCERDLDPRLRVAVLRCLKAMVHITWGVLLLVSTAFFGKAKFVWSLKKICLGAGMLTAVMGHRFLPYRNAGVETAERADASPDTRLGQAL